MKTCPHCHIQVGGAAEYCPLCQNALVGEESPGRYPRVVPPARQASLFYRIAAFLLLGASVICGAVDYLAMEEEHLHFSVLVLLFSVAALLLLRALLQPGRNAPKLLFQILIGASLISAFCDWFLGWNGLSVDWLIPVWCCAALVLNFIFAFINRRFTENGLVYLLLNIAVGVVPYLALAVHNSAKPPTAWLVCLVTGILTFLGLVIFKGRSLRAELEKRLHL